MPDVTAMFSGLADGHQIISSFLHFRMATGGVPLVSHLGDWVLLEECSDASDRLISLESLCSME